MIDAQRVPPSPCRTSQSTVIVASPIAAMSTTLRSARPMSRWISAERPASFSFDTSRGLLSRFARGSIEYSAVTQPSPVPLRWNGTPCSMLAVQ